MEKKSNIDIYGLFLNKMMSDVGSEMELNIYQAIMENMEKINLIGIKSLAQLASTSPASISRFVSMFPVASYKEFTHRLHTSAANLRFAKELHNNLLENNTIEEIIQKEYEGCLANYSSTFNSLKATDYISIVNQIKNAKSVTFIGANHSLEIMSGLQVKLNVMNLPAFIFKQEQKLDFFIKHLGSTDLALFVAIEGRYQSYKGNKILKQLHQQGVTCLLLSQSKRIDTTYFDEVYYYGQNRAGNSGYYSLHVIVELLSKALDLG